MRVLVQRVSRASVTVDNAIVGEIAQGLLALVGVCEGDDDNDIAWLVNKLVNLRIFDDAAGVMNHNVREVGGGVLAVSQFTLYASTVKGNRPSYSAAAKAEISKPMFERFVAALSAALQRAVPTGVFGADMQVSLINDGPVTIWLDSKARG
jgi:D-tyrosyl-tRNA(Tyr) deacylase